MLHSSELFFNSSAYNNSVEERCFDIERSDVESEPYSLSHEISRLIPLLNTEQPFFHLDLGLSGDDIEVVNKLRITNYNAYRNSGYNDYIAYNHNGNFTNLQPDHYAFLPDLYESAKLGNLYDNTKFFIEGLADENSKVSEPIAKLIT